jgi:methionyl aminopeptidase
VAHGVPGDRPFRDGDIVAVDLGCRFGGWCADSAETHVVGRGSRAGHRLVDTTRAVLEQAIEEIARRETWREVVERIEPFLERSGFRLVDVVFGHGIGREMHEPPQVALSLHSTVYDFVDFDLRPGLVFTIEPVLTTGTGAVRLADDQWTIVTSDGHPAAHCEHTIAITRRGVVVLTRE